MATPQTTWEDIAAASGLTPQQLAMFVTDFFFQARMRSDGTEILLVFTERGKPSVMSMQQVLDWWKKDVLPERLKMMRGTDAEPAAGAKPELAVLGPDGLTVQTK